MTDPAGEIRFFFDFVSNNAYLAWTQIHALASRYQRSVVAMPVLFAGLLDAHGQLGPAEVQPKVRWMVRNVLRKAASLNIPLNPPASHPFNPLLALRVVSQPLDEDVRSKLIDRLFRAVWQDRLDVSSARVVAGLASELGLDGADLVAQSSDTWTKDVLRKQTDLAIQQGVFGVPSMLVDGELFWGYDDFPQLELFLAGDGRIDQETLARWDSVRPSAVRRRLR